MVTAQVRSGPFAYHRVGRPTSSIEGMIGGCSYHSVGVLLSPCEHKATALKEGGREGGGKGREGGNNKATGGHFGRISVHTCAQPRRSPSW